MKNSVIKLICICIGIWITMSCMNWSENQKSENPIAYEYGSGNLNKDLSDIDSILNLRNGINVNKGKDKSDSLQLPDLKLEGSVLNPFNGKEEKSVSNQNLSVQKIDSDSLLMVIINDMQTNKNYIKNIQRGLLGIKIAPEYSDFYFLLGRNYDLLKKRDSARYYYNYFIEKYPKNEDAFNHLINLELEEKNYKDAEVIIDQAISLHPENKNFERQKLTVFQLQKDRKKEYDYLKMLQLKNPNDDAITQLIIQLEIKDMQTNKNYEKIIQRALSGIKIDSTNLDYYLLLGRNYDFLQKKDSARYFYKYYIEKNPDNEDTFNYLINLEFEEKNYKDAEVIIDQAILLHPENKSFERQKLTVFQLQKDQKKEYDYLKLLQLKNPYDEAIAQLIIQLEIKDMQTNKNYKKIIQNALLGIKIDSTNLDYYLLLGRSYDFLQKKDSARYYYNYFIEKNPDNEDTFNYLINLEFEEKNYKDAEVIIDKAIALHPENKNFEQKKLTVFQLQKDQKKEYDYLNILQKKYPNDDAITQLIFQLESKFKTDRAGVNYSFTTFDRKGYGPWHLLSLHYIRERQWGSLIGRVNFANRLSSGQSIANGIQYELESYFFTGKNNYSYVSAGFSKEPVFPQLALGYSFYQNFKKGWEGDLGLRYIKTQDGGEFTTVVVGVGKYVGPYWINLRTFILEDVQDYYPAFTLTVRYYFDTRFDYLAFISGYGSSPEEQNTLGQFTERISLDSYRVGAGYYRMFGKHFITGIQFTYNHQEYVENLTQNELELSLMLQYKF